MSVLMRKSANGNVVATEMTGAVLAGVLTETFGLSAAPNTILYPVDTKEWLEARFPDDDDPETTARVANELQNAFGFSR
jgi:hypothetical protein